MVKDGKMMWNATVKANWKRASKTGSNVSNMPYPPSDVRCRPASRFWNPSRRDG